MLISFSAASPFATCDGFSQIASQIHEILLHFKLEHMKHRVLHRILTKSNFCIHQVKCKFTIPGRSYSWSPEHLVLKSRTWLPGLKTPRVIRCKAFKGLELQYHTLDQGGDILTIPTVIGGSQIVVSRTQSRLKRR